MMSKFILLVLAISFVTISSAQVETLHQIEIKSGYLFDKEDNRLQVIQSLIGDNNKINYQGFQYFGIGYTQSKKKVRAGFEFDFFKYEERSPREKEIETPPNYNRSKTQGQISFFYGKSIFNSKKLDLYIAPIASATYRKEIYYINDGFDHPLSVEDWVLGIGGKLQGNLKITKKLGLSIGTKLIFLDYFMRNDKTEFRTFTLDFIRGDAVLQLGLVFNL